MSERVLVRFDLPPEDLGNLVRFYGYAVDAVIHVSPSLPGYAELHAQLSEVIRTGLIIEDDPEDTADHVIAMLRGEP